jgi:uncharacterized protein YfiM (DUF2279 family)
MKRLIAGLVAVLMLTPSLCYASSMDKALHISASAVTETVLAHNKPFCTWKPWQRSLFNVAVIGGGKEWYDSKHDGHAAEWGDIAADAIGAVSAEGVVWIVHKTW